MNKLTSTDTLAAGAHTLIPLSRLLKSPRNARKTPHSAASIEAKAASIAAKGILQNLVVEPEVDGANLPTGRYFVTIGEGRRLGQLLRVERGEITEDEPMPCVIDLINDPQEISLDENVTREAMHPADQFEAFLLLNVERGMGVEDIAARFGVSVKIVQQRLRLGAASPRLMQVYRDGGLTLTQLMAFCLTADHQRQEAVFDRLPEYNRDPYQIRRALTEGRVGANDRRAKFVGVEAYCNAGGQVERDLFTEDGDGYFTDPALLDSIAIQRLTAIAVALQNAEGWKWAEAYIDFPHGHGHGRVYPKAMELSAENQRACQTARDALLALSTQYEDYDELPDDIDAQMTALEAEIAQFEALTTAYASEDTARGGLILSLDYHGQPKVERGFIRAEDLASEGEEDADDTTTDEGGDGGDFRDDQDTDTELEDEQPQAALSDALVRDLTSHRTFALRLALGEQPELAARALAYTLVLDIFYASRNDSCLDLRAVSVDVAGWMDDYAGSPAVEAVQVRHDAWAGQLPRSEALWPHLLAMAPEDLGLLIAHCVSLTINAVRQPYGNRSALAFSDQLASNLALDMTAHWQPTARSYFGRVTKGQIGDAVREAKGDAAAKRIAPLKKPDMAEAAEGLVAGTGWLPALLRTAPVTSEAGLDADDASDSEGDAETPDAPTDGNETVVTLETHRRR